MSALDQPPENPSRAAEYVLGVMAPSEVALFEQDMIASQDLRAEVTQWQEHFVSLTNAIAPVQPPAKIYNAISKQLFGAPERWWHGLSFLRTLAGGATAALATLLVIAFLVPAPRPDPTAIVQVAAADDELILRIGYFAGSNEIITHPQGPMAREGRVVELWFIAEGNAPVSLGVLAENTDEVIALPEALRDAVLGGVLAISDEPPGGSPTGAPTGDVLAVGNVTAL